MKKSTLPLLIILAALAFGIPARWRLIEARRALLSSRARLAELQKQIAADESSFDSARREQEKQNRERARVTAAVAKAQANLSKIDPESQWASPPASLPDWNSRSPYIWVTKDSLALLHPVALDTEGGLTRDAAAILAVDEETRFAMNAQLERALADFHSLQLSNAQVSNQPSDGSTTGSAGVTVQIASMSEQGAAFRDQIEQILQQNIGDQRASLVTNMAADWFGNFSGQSPIVASVTLQPDGNYQISYASSGNNSTSGGIPAASVRNYVPNYLLPFFSGLLTPPAESQ